jgi:hypothetical protein
MIEGEIYLLEAVRDTIRDKLGLTATECDCEYDEQIPSIAGDRYVAVIPAGCDPGPKHQTSAGVHDALHAVQVLILVRATTTPRDRRRSVFLERLNGINTLLSGIIKVIDWQMDLLSLTNHLLAVDYPAAQPFNEMLRLTRIDAKPRMVNSEAFASGPSAYVAMARSAWFGRCRRMQTVIQTPKALRAP